MQIKENIKFRLKITQPLTNVSTWRKNRCRIQKLYLRAPVYQKFDLQGIQSSVPQLKLKGRLIPGGNMCRVQNS